MWFFSFHRGIGAIGGLTLLLCYLPLICYIKKFTDEQYLRKWRWARGLYVDIIKKIGAPITPIATAIGIERIHKIRQQGIKPQQHLHNSWAVANGPTNIATREDPTAPNTSNTNPKATMTGKNNNVAIKYNIASLFEIYST